MVPTHAPQIQNGGRPPSWKNRKKVLLTDIINSQLKTGNKTAISANIGLNVQKKLQLYTLLTATDRKPQKL